jgi:hypothetical protein
MSRVQAKFARGDTVWCLKKGAVGVKGRVLKVISEGRSWQYEVKLDNKRQLTASSNSFTKNEGDVAKKRQQFDGKRTVGPQPGKRQKVKDAYHERGDVNSDDNR